jgi:CRP-like cAMP-binding protein
MATTASGKPAAAETEGPAVFASRGWLADAPPALRARLIAAGRVMPVARGARVYDIGSTPGGIYGVISGGIGGEGGTQWHTPRLAHVYRAGHWFGHGPALVGGRRTIGAFATENSLLLNVPLPALRTLMHEDAKMTRLVGGMANLGTVLAAWVACDLLIPDAPRRIAAVLLRVTGALEGVEPNDPRGFVLTQTELGDMANASRNHVNRVLGSFFESGWIEQRYGHLRLRDVAALKAFAYSED